MDADDSAAVSRGSAPTKTTLPEYPAPLKAESLAVHNATGSLEIMGQLVLNEWELLRHNIRELGRKIRQMSSKVAAATVQRLWHQLLWLLTRHSSSIPAQFELDAALILNEMEKQRAERPPPRDTLADLRRVLLEDVEEEGIVHGRRAAAWREMPPPRRAADAASPVHAGDASAYQLFNRPMTVVDDDFDRLSLPSTHFAQSESDKIVGLEAQLSLLTRQLNMLMMNGVPPASGGSQRNSRPVSRSHSRASLYQHQQHLSAASLAAHNPSLARLNAPPPLSPTSDDDGVYMADDTASSYASPSHTIIPIPLPPPQQHQQRGAVAGGRRQSTMPSTISMAPPPPPPLLLQTTPTGLQHSSSSSTLRGQFSPGAAGSCTPTLLQLQQPASPDSGDDAEYDPPFSPLPPPPPAVVQQLQQQRQDAIEAAVASTGATPGRSFLDDINKGNFALRKMSSDKSPTNSNRSESTSGGEEEEEQDENSSGPLVKPTTRQLLSRKDSLRRISTDRSPGGTPLNRSRRRAPSLGQDGGVNLFKGDYLAAALANKFNTIRVNEEDDDQSVTAGDQSWCDE